jgi:hypothetical protein
MLLRASKGSGRGYQHDLRCQHRHLGLQHSRCGDFEGSSNWKRDRGSLSLILVAQVLAAHRGQQVRDHGRLPSSLIVNFVGLKINLKLL